MLAVAEGVVGSAPPLIVAEVAATGYAGVHRASEEVVELDRLLAILANLQILRTEEFDRTTGFVVVEFVAEEDVGPDALNDFGNFAGLLIVAFFQVGDELAIGVAEERSVIRRDADRAVGGERRADKNDQQRPECQLTDAD